LRDHIFKKDCDLDVELGNVEK